MFQLYLLLRNLHPISSSCKKAPGSPRNGLPGNCGGNIVIGSSRAVLAVSVCVVHRKSRTVGDTQCFVYEGMGIEDVVYGWH